MNTLNHPHSLYFWSMHTSNLVYTNQGVIVRIIIRLLWQKVIVLSSLSTNPPLLLKPISCLLHWYLDLVV